jgi:hypothetical protein
MSNYWQPKIDNWITENINVNNTTSFPISYQYAPNEGEEMFKVHVANFGPMTVKQMKEKICEILEDLHGAANGDDGEGIERIHHQLYGAPEFNNLVAKYIDTIKSIRSQSPPSQEKH